MTRAFLKPREFSILGRRQEPLIAPPRSAETSPSTKADLERAAAGIIMGNRSVPPRPRLAPRRHRPTPIPSPRARNGSPPPSPTPSSPSNLDKRFQANAYAKTFLEDQMKQLKLRLEESEKVLLDFAQKEQIVAVTEKVLDRREQSRRRQCGARQSHLRAHQERAAVEAGRLR